MWRDDGTLVDIARAARLIAQLCAGLDRAEFMNDERTQSAVLHQLLIIGEAVKRLSSELRSAHPGVPWKFITGMRDKLIHAYDEVDLEEVGATAQKDVPELLRVVESLSPPP